MFLHATAYFYFIMLTSFFPECINVGNSGTSKVAEPYRIGNRTADAMLEVLNLDKKEVVSIDGISNQEFSEVTGDNIAIMINIYRIDFFHSINQDSYTSKNTINGGYY